MQKFIDCKKFIFKITDTRISMNKIMRNKREYLELLKFFPVVSSCWKYAMTGSEQPSPMLCICRSGRQQSNRQFWPQESVSGPLSPSAHTTSAQTTSSQTPFFSYSVILSWQLCNAQPWSHWLALLPTRRDCLCLNSFHKVLISIAELILKACLSKLKLINFRGKSVLSNSHLRLLFEHPKTVYWRHSVRIGFCAPQRFCTYLYYSFYLYISKETNLKHNCKINYNFHFSLKLIA